MQLKAHSEALGAKGKTWRKMYQNISPRELQLPGLLCHCPQEKCNTDTFNIFTENLVFLGISPDNWGGGGGEFNLAQAQKWETAMEKTP